MYKHKSSNNQYEFIGFNKNFSDIDNESNEVVLRNVKTGSKEIVSLINLTRFFEKI